MAYITRNGFRVLGANFYLLLLNRDMI